jgi:hypothetical protein
MKVPVGRGNAQTSDVLSNPAVIVVLVIMLGAIFYLWRTGYIRRGTSLIIISALLLALAAIAVQTYGVSL